MLRFFSFVLIGIAVLAVIATFTLWLVACWQSGDIANRLGLTGVVTAILAFLSGAAGFIMHDASDY